MTRKRYSRRQVLEHWEAAHGRCWRCGERITGTPTPLYGRDWCLGHVGAAHWMGGVNVAPEHIDCNKTDGVAQTKAAAKSVRIRARAAGIKKRQSKPLPGTYASGIRKKANGEVLVLRNGEWVPYCGRHA